ncbi:MAG: sigma-54-dependent Fis family transcriptional regulator [Rhizobiaceae bacterium]|nr:sigma-54-dependent Fis family transcriptional regulator [Rhizobiaceae bacterium]
MASTVLIIDDDPVQRRLLEAAVTKFGHTARLADGGEAGLKALDGAGGGNVAVVILDLVMPGMDGLAVLQTMRERGIEVPVIVQTAQGGIETVVSAMRQGAFDFVVKPASPDRLNKAISDALKVEAYGGVKREDKRASTTLTIKDLITESPAMERVVSLARKAAGSNIPVLIEGESGVGKEMIARVIQGASERRNKPFVTVNCGAIPDNLVESILFGHEKGSFTGASEKHIGKFVEAHTGTLFLDEIGDLPLDVQVKLLRAVQQGEVDPVGGRATIKVDIRFISATHRDLIEQVKHGHFREDLFYRLNVFPIMIPPLRDRREDIPHLIRHFVSKIGRETGSGVRTINPQALAMLQAYDWPGNIRQLENAIFRASVLCEGDALTVDEFPQIKAQVEGVVFVSPPVRETTNIVHTPATTPIIPAAIFEQTDDSPGALNALDAQGNIRPLIEVEQEMIEFAIRYYEGQMSEVARRLGIGRSTLYRKLKEYGIDPEAMTGDRTVG